MNDAVALLVQIRTVILLMAFPHRAFPFMFTKRSSKRNLSRVPLVFNPCVTWGSQSKAHTASFPQRPRLDHWPWEPVPWSGSPTGAHRDICQRDQWVGPTSRPWHPAFAQIPRGLRSWLKTRYSDTEVSRQRIYETDKSTTALWVKNPVPTKCPFSLKLPTLASTRGVPRGSILGWGEKENRSR